MAGRRRARRPANDDRASKKGTPRGGERGGRKGEARVIPFPHGRRSRRSRTPEKKPAGRSAGHGRLRLVVGAVAVALACLSLGARAVQLSVAEDGRYQAFAAERQPRHVSPAQS